MKRNEDVVNHFADNEALRVAVAFAQWITIYASQLGNGWVMVKGTEPIIMTCEQLYDEFQKAKAVELQNFKLKIKCQTKH